MTAVQSVASMIAHEVITPEGVESEAPTPGPFLQLIEQIIQMILPMLAGCLPIPKQAAVVNRPNLIQREQLVALINLHAPLDAPKVALYQAFIKVGKKLTTTQVTAMQTEDNPKL